jgi:integrase
MAEQRTLNPQVLGSNPRGRTRSEWVFGNEILTCDYNVTTIVLMRGTKTEVRPGVWRLRVYAGRGPNGSPIQVARTVETGDGKSGSGSRLADRELAKIVAEVSNGSKPTGTETVGDLLARWLDHCDSQGRSPTTIREYRRIADKVIVPDLGHIRLAKLSASDLDALYAKLTSKGNKATTVRRVHALIGASLRQAEKWDLVDFNVARKASPPPIRTQPVRAPSPSEVRDMVEAAEAIEPALGALLLIGALTGARRGELCALRWTDVDFASRRLTIARSVYETDGGGWAEKGTKSHQVRSLGLDDMAVAVLERHRAHVDGLAEELRLEVLTEAFVFSRSPVGAEPLRPDVVTKLTKRAAEAAGVKTHLHALRHFSATQAIAAGFDPATVAGRLGHRDSSITLKVYSHALEARDRDLADALGRVLAPELKS